MGNLDQEVISDEAPFSQSDLMSLALDDFKQLSWLVGDLRRVEGVIHPGLGHVPFKTEIFTTAFYLTRSNVIINIEKNYTKITGLPVEEMWLNFQNLLSDLKTRGYMDGYRKDVYKLDFAIRSLMRGRVDRDVVDVLFLDGVKMYLFEELSKDLVESGEQKKYQDALMPWLNKAKFRFDRENNILHKDFYEKTLHLKKTRGKNNKVNLLHFVFSQSYQSGEWIKPDTEGIREKLKAKQLYHAAYDLNRDIKVVFDVSDFFEIDHQFSWVKCCKI